MSRAIDLIITYRVVKMLVTPFNKFKAYDLGIIDEKGKVLKKFLSFIIACFNISANPQIISFLGKDFKKDISLKTNFGW